VEREVMYLSISTGVTAITKGGATLRKPDGNVNNTKRRE
jgi:hypothetical protein